VVWPWISATKELEWARQFHVDEPFGTPSDDFGAQQRFIGMIMALLPKMQVQAWMQQPDRFQDMWLATTPWLWFGVAGGCYWPSWGWGSGCRGGLPAFDRRGEAHLNRTSARGLGSDPQALFSFLARGIEETNLNPAGRPCCEQVVNM